ncbi:phosphopantetheine-binding protein [Croceicoccus sp. F390]|uniref:Phosphopantetheine-binding protein n=1 Tax=Croceicoccus esteveae TaxID=3075597 RepID=A0ABU2ZK35_9SPHN|nr:phosphopantetheine-binding protein [Croceicoccus sp. F390]MDT0576969.1 phosphopantetheine-binding protein [Croceicoccus sp. F390]
MSTLTDLRDILADLRPAEKQEDVAKDASLFDAGVLDSMAMMELVPAIEEKFHIAVKPMELSPENFDTLDAMAHFIGQKQNES